MGIKPFSWFAPSSRLGSSLLTRAFAMQSSPAQARGGQSLRGGWTGQNPATTLRPDWGVPATRPSQPQRSAKGPVAGRVSKSYDGPTGQLDCKVAWNTPSPPTPSRHKSYWAVHAILQNGTTGLHVGPQRGAEKSESQVSSWSPADR